MLQGIIMKSTMKKSTTRPICKNTIPICGGQVQESKQYIPIIGKMHETKRHIIINVQHSGLDIRFIIS
jgi:hypothetical protein